MSPIVVIHRWSVNLAAEHCELVSQHDDLEIFGTARTDSEPNEPNHEAVGGASHHLIVGSCSRRSTPTAEFPTPTGSQNERRPPNSRVLMGQDVGDRDT